MIYRMGYSISGQSALLSKYLILSAYQNCQIWLKIIDNTIKPEYRVLYTDEEWLTTITNLRERNNHRDFHSLFSQIRDNKYCRSHDRSRICLRCFASGYNQRMFCCHRVSNSRSCLLLFSCISLLILLLWLLLCTLACCLEDGNTADTARIKGLCRICLSKLSNKANKSLAPSNTL